MVILLSAWCFVNVYRSLGLYRPGRVYDIGLQANKIAYDQPRSEKLEAYHCSIAFNSHTTL